MCLAAALFSLGWLVSRLWYYVAYFRGEYWHVGWRPRWWWLGCPGIDEQDDGGMFLRTSITEHGCLHYGHISVLHVTFSPDPQTIHICYLLTSEL